MVVGRRLLFCLDGTDPAAHVACVWPMKGEIDLRPFCIALHERGQKILLPETTPKGQPLVFRQWEPDCVMAAGRFQTWHPEGPVLTPDIILVPLVGFDRRGYRLGYGGGYYDRTLAHFSAARPIGYAHSSQEVPEIPIGPHDVALPLIVTEREAIRCDASFSGTSLSPC